jgi:hypothetical protein
MGNGIKMRAAVDENGTEYAIETLQTEYDANTPLPDLFCSNPICRKAVRFVPRHQQNRKGRIEPVDIPAYLGLTSGSEHVHGCRYDAAKRITVIVDQSDPDFMSELQEGKRDLRLLVLHNGLSGKPLSGNTPPPITLSATGSGNVTKQFVSSDAKLSSYLRTTADLLALRELCESDAILAKELTLRFGPKRIAWSDFFFTADRFDEAWELLHQACGNAHPLALVGEVKSHYPPKSHSKYKSTFLNCCPLYRKTESPDTIDSFEVSVMHVDAEWLASFPVGTRIIMFGLWECRDVEESSAKGTNQKGKIVTYVTHKLILRPKFKQQILNAF